MVVGCVTIQPTAGAQDDKPAAAGKSAVDDAKTHTLFMGADVSVGLDKKLYAVRGVSGSSWVIDVNGHTRVVSARSGPIDLKVTPSLKITRTTATVAHLRSGRGYTPNNDPTVRLTQALNQTALTSAEDHAAVNQATAANLGLVSAAAMGVNKAYAADLPAGLKAQAEQQVQNQLAADNQAQGATIAQSDAEDSIGGRAAGSAGFDAMDVEFEISSARPLPKPYVITMTRFHPKGTRPGTVQSLVYAKELNPIDAHPGIVHLVEGGFPYDFEPIDFQLHVYNRGQEVATSVSSKRVELTSDEAFEYIKLEYVSAHKGDTLPAVPAMGDLPADLPRRTAEGEYRQTVFVRVSKEGLASEAFADATCSKRIEDPYLEAVVRSIRFKPALNRGEPVEGVASLRLEQLKI